MEMTKAGGLYYEASPGQIHTENLEEITNTKSHTTLLRLWVRKVSFLFSPISLGEEKEG